MGGSKRRGADLIPLRGWLIPFAAAAVLFALWSRGHAHDGGQWEASNPAIKEWYRTLMQPDIPSASCCGEADAYWCDDVHVRSGRAFCRITDDREDAPLRRQHVDVGTEFHIPDAKLKYDRGNPTGHAVIFLSRGGAVYCFVQGSGI